MQNPNIKFTMSTESFTMLAQRALLISLLPDQPQQDPIGVMRPPPSLIVRVRISCCGQKASDHALSNGHHAHQE
jgi:hypothetical protein